MLGIALLSSFLALRAISELGRTVDYAADHTSRSLALAEQLRTVLYQARFSSRGMSLSLIAKRPATWEKAKQTFQESVEQIQQIANQLRPLLATEAELRRVEGSGRTIAGLAIGAANDVRVGGRGGPRRSDEGAGRRGAHRGRGFEDKCAVTLIGLESKSMAEAAVDSKAAGFAGICRADRVAGRGFYSRGRDDRNHVGARAAA
jgi:hypothetical protein